VHDQHEKGQRRRNRDHVQEGPCAGLEHADDRGHAHVLAALEGDHRAQHSKPQKQDAGQLVRPHDGLARVAPNNSGEQDDDLGDDEQRRRDLNKRD